MKSRHHESSVPRIMEALGCSRHQKEYSLLYNVLMFKFLELSLRFMCYIVG